MREVASNQPVAVYHYGDDFEQSSKHQPLTYAEALQVVADKRGRWWNRKRLMLVMFPKESSLEYISARPGARGIEGHAEAVNSSSNPNHPAIAAARAWTGEVLPGEALRDRTVA